MADAKYLIETAYNSAGVKKFTRDLQNAEAQSRKFASGLSRDAKIISAQTQQAFTRSGKAITKTTAVFDDHGKKVTVVTGQVGRVMGLVTQSIKQFANQTNKTTPIMNQFVTALRRVAIVVPVWFLFRQIFTQTMTLIRNSIKFLVAWEYQMAQIRIVSNESTIALGQLSSSLVNLSRVLGISTKDLGEGAKLYAQQGRAISEILPLMEATSRLSLLTGRTIVQSVEDMTAVLKAYELEASQATGIVDEITNVMLNHAITAGDLASAYKQVASTASSLGVSLEALTGFVTAIKTVTRDTGSKVGLSLRTMFSRITTSSAEAIQELTGIPLFLDAMGRATTTVTPNLRNLDTVIGELSSRFQSLGTAQQSQLAVLIGGVRRQNQVFALFNNFTEAIEAQTDALFSMGEADKAIGVLTDTVELRVKRLQGAWEGFVNAVADTSVFKRSLGIITEIVEAQTATFNRQAFVTSELKKQLSEQQKQSSEQLAFVQSLTKAEALVKEMVDSYEAGRISAKELDVRTKAIVAGIQGKGARFGFQVDADSADTLLEELQAKISERRGLYVEAEVQIQRAQLRDQLLTTASEIRNVVEQQLVDLPGFGIDTVAFEKVINLIKTGNLDQLSKNLALTGTAENLAKINTQFQNLSNVTDEQKQAFDKLIASFDQTARAINSIAGIEEEAGAKFTAERLKANEKIIVTAITEDQLKKQLVALEHQSTLNQTDKLEYLKQSLAVLNQEGAVLDDQLRNKRDSITQDIAKLETERSVLRIQLRQKTVIEQLKAGGASNLQLAIQELAFLDAINASEEERLKKVQEINKLKIQTETQATDAILSAQQELLRLQGANEVQVIRATLELEKQLGIQRSGIDLLKQRLDLVKAVAQEQQKSREDRLSELRQTIIQTAKDKSPEYQSALDRQEKALRARASQLGLGEEEVDQILKAPTLEDNLQFLGTAIRTDLPTELKNVLADPMTQSMTRLVGAIETLTRSIVAEESVRPTLTGTQRVGTTLPQAPLAPLPTITRGTTIGGGINKLIEVNLGDRQVYFNSSLNDRELQVKVKDILQSEDQSFIERVTKRVATLIRTPGTALNQADRESLEDF